MDRTSPSWRDRFPDEITCVRCLQVREARELDRLLWCESCRTSARRRSRWIGWIGGGGVALLLALWVWLIVRPTTLTPAVWAACVAAAFWLSSKVIGEAAYGVERYRNRKARDAVPPPSP